MLTNKEVRTLNELNPGSYQAKLGNILRHNEFERIEPFYSERIRHNDGTVLDNACAMIAELSKKLDAKCTVSFDLSAVNGDNSEVTYYIGEKIALPAVPLVEGKRLRFVDGNDGSVNDGTVALHDMTVKASYIDNAYTYVKYFNASDIYNPYESVKIKLNGNIPAPSVAPLAPEGKKEFIGWYDEPQSYIRFTLNGADPVKADIGSPLSYQPTGIDLVKGDITLDGKLDTSDVIRLYQILAGSELDKLGEYEKIVLDYNEDGNIDVSDAISILQSIAGKGENMNISELCLYAWWK